MPLLHLAGNVAVLIRGEALGVAILLRIARADARPLPEALVLHDGGNHRLLRPEFDVAWRDIRRHHSDDIVLIEETIEEASERHPHVACALEAHVRRVEEDDEAARRIGRVRQ